MGSKREVLTVKGYGLRLKSSLLHDTQFSLKSGHIQWITSFQQTYVHTTIKKEEVIMWGSNLFKYKMVTTKTNILSGFKGKISWFVKSTLIKCPTTLSAGASWKYLYKRGSSFLKWRSKNEGALYSK